MSTTTLKLKESEVFLAVLTHVPSDDITEALTLNTALTLCTMEAGTPCSKHHLKHFGSDMT